MQTIPGLPEDVEIEVRRGNEPLAMNADGVVALTQPKLLTICVVSPIHRGARCFFVQGGKVSLAHVKDHPKVGRMFSFGVRIKAKKGQWHVADQSGEIFLALPNDKEEGFQCHRISVEVRGAQQVVVRCAAEVLSPQRISEVQKALSVLR